MSAEEKPSVSKSPNIAKFFGYAGMVVYMYFGIYKGHDVSELFLVLVTLLIVGADVAIKVIEARK